MPNHTVNTVKLKGIGKADLYTLERRFNKNGDEYFDFNKLVPEPKTKEECPPEFIDHGNCHLQHDDGREWFNWYDWHCCFWGTKWNSYWLEKIDDDTISFTTAWSEPEPIWKALSEKFQDKELDIHAEYEDGLETWSRWLNGERMDLMTKEYASELIF